jgi:molybdopterin-containing oxidoreductase family iron-sulfur binding subunit
VAPGDISLWKGHEYKDHHWGMAIDLNTCTGCAACVVACNVENNVSLVGKDEVLRRREMHWLRIDRYYSSSAEENDYRGLEKASENPEVTFQPMLCQHCNNAPCETVCPVAATTHSTEGLNQMTYNRCIGTRYCANNCPYKVRRFNWFKYHDNQQFYQSNPAMNTDLGRMVLNPEVTVRSRGVMEKCSFCAQRIQTGKLNAKKEKRPVKDGEVVTACMAACSTGAILFGDMNDSESRISKLLQITKDEKRPYGIDKKIGNPRAYRVLEEIGVKPNIFYLTKIRNKDNEKENA